MCWERSMYVNVHCWLLFTVTVTVTQGHSIPFFHFNFNFCFIRINFSLINYETRKSTFTQNATQSLWHACLWLWPDVMGEYGTASMTSVMIIQILFWSKNIIENRSRSHKVYVLKSKLTVMSKTATQTLKHGWGDYYFNRKRIDPCLKPCSKTA